MPNTQYMDAKYTFIFKGITYFSNFLLQSYLPLFVLLVWLSCTSVVFFPCIPCSSFVLACYGVTRIKVKHAWSKRYVSCKKYPRNKVSCFKWLLSKKKKKKKKWEMSKQITFFLNETYKTFLCFREQLDFNKKTSVNKFNAIRLLKRQHLQHLVQKKTKITATQQQPFW